jgi:hypothetical protein
MSTESVKEIIGKAVVDEEYRELLFNEPDKALEGYDLTEEERKALREVKRDKFNEAAIELQERLSRSGILNWTGESLADPRPSPVLSIDDFLRK